MTKVLSGKKRQSAMENLPGWRDCKNRDAICKTFKFKDFRQTFAWMTSIALMAEKIDHHPEWFNVYNKVDVVLTTHSQGGVTLLDIELAKYMNDSTW